MIGASVFEGDDAPIGFGSAGPSVGDFRSDADGVADENWVRKGRLIKSEVAEGGAEGGIGNRQTNDES